MYIVSILKTDGTCVSVTTRGDNVLSLANILEVAPTVINFKVSSSDAVGIKQQIFGGGDYSKWVTQLST